LAEKVQSRMRESLSRLGLEKEEDVNKGWIRVVDKNKRKVSVSRDDLYYLRKCSLTRSFNKILNGIRSRS